MELNKMNAIFDLFDGVSELYEDGERFHRISSEIEKLTVAWIEDARETVQIISQSFENFKEKVQELKAAFELIRSDLEDDGREDLEEKFSFVNGAIERFENARKAALA